MNAVSSELKRRGTIQQHSVQKAAYCWYGGALVPMELGAWIVAWGCKIHK